jgi:hypothetical protein
MTMMVRTVTLFYGLWVLYSLYQFKIQDGWGTSLLAGLTLGLFSLTLILFSIRIVYMALKARRHEHGLERLFIHKPWIRKYGVFYDEFKVYYWWFFIPMLTATFARNAFLALGNGNGMLQVLGQLCVDFILLMLMMYTKPFNTRMGNIINVAIQCVRVASMILLLMFTKEVGLNGIATTAIGAVLLALQSLLSILLIVLIMIGATLGLVRGMFKSRKRAAAQENEASAQFDRDDEATIDIYGQSDDHFPGSSTASPGSHDVGLEKEQYEISTTAHENNIPSSSPSTASVRSYHTVSERDTVSPPLSTDKRNSYMIRKVESAHDSDDIFDFLRSASQAGATRISSSAFSETLRLPTSDPDSPVATPSSADSLSGPFAEKKHKGVYFGGPESNPIHIDYGSSSSRHSP